MLKLVIADDEVFVRFGIKSTIDWNTLGFDIVGDAEDGLKALEIARAVRPDVVLTDIMMPKMNGLELIKALKTEMPQTKIVVLSCYKDYEYVREAMQLWGAVDYLFKLTMQPEELVGVMTKVRNMIEEEQKIRRETTELRTHLNENWHAARNRLLNDVLDRSIVDADAIDARFRKLRIPLAPRAFAAVCMVIDDYDTVVTQRNKFGDVKLLIFTICNVVEETLQNDGRGGAIFHRRDGEFGILVQEGGEAGAFPERMKRLLQQVLSTFRKYLNISVSFGVGGIFRQFSDIPGAYGEAVAAAEYRMYSSGGTLHFAPADEPAGSKPQPYFDGKAEQELRARLESGSPEQVQHFVFSMLDTIREQRRLRPPLVYAELKEVMGTFSSVLRQHDGSLAELHDPDGQLPWEALSRLPTLAEIREWFGAFIVRYAAYLNELRERRYSRDISKAVRYIHDRYSESIRLKDVANHIHISETYLSSMFRKETGQYFTDYLNGCRIGKAKEMLKRGDRTVNEVSELVGYASLSYFSRVFKQLEGISPAEYKNTR